MRLETGTIQCDDDWPGVFIRGDNAFDYRIAVAAGVEALVKSGDHITAAHLASLGGLLASSNAQSDQHTENSVQHVTLKT